MLNDYKDDMKIMLKCQTIENMTFMILLYNKYHDDYAFCQGIYAGTLLLYAQEIAMNHLWSQVGISRGICQENHDPGLCK